MLIRRIVTVCVYAPLDELKVDVTEQDHQQQHCQNRPMTPASSALPFDPSLQQPRLRAPPELTVMSRIDGRELAHDAEEGEHPVNCKGGVRCQRDQNAPRRVCPPG